MKSAAKVGLLLVVFVVLTIATFSVLGKSLLPTSKRNFYVVMADAGGLTPGTRVLMAGVQIGEVDKIELMGPYHARITLNIHKNAQVPIGTEAVIPGSLIGLGDTPLTIVPPEIITGYLQPGATIPGRKAGPLDAILPNGGKDLYGETNKTMAAVRKLLEDQKLQNDLKKIIETASATLQASQTSLARFDALAARTDNLLARNEGNLDAMVKTAHATLEQIHDSAVTFTAFLKQGKLQNGTLALMDKASKIETQAGQLLAQLDKTASDPELNRDLRATAHNAAATSAQGPAIAANAQQITANMAAITEKSKDLPEKIGEVATKAGKLEDKLSDLIDKFNGVKAPSNGGLSNLSTEIDLLRQTDPGRWRTDLNASIPTHEGFVTFGIYDALESNKLTVQLGKNLSPKLDYRYGVYASKVGLGVDYRFNSKLGLRTDLWDINSPRFDARLRYDFGNGLIGWVGADRIFRTTAPTIGIGVVR